MLVAMPGPAYLCRTSRQTHYQTLVPARRLILIIASAFSITVKAGTMDWHDGVIVLTSNQVLVGKITIQPALEIVLFKSQNQSTFFAVRDINYITINDSDANIPRKFVALKVPDYPTMQLFEVVVKGVISVVRKSGRSYVPAIDDVGAFEYFILEEGDVVRMGDFRKKVYPTIAASCSPDRMKRFLREKGIDPANNADAFRLIEYYNRGLLASASEKESRQNLY